MYTVWLDEQRYNTCDCTSIEFYINVHSHSSMIIMLLGNHKQPAVEQINYIT